MTIDSLASMQARVTQLSALTSSSAAASTGSATESSAASDTEFASALASAVGLFSNGAGTGSTADLSSSLSSLLSGVDFTSGVGTSATFLSTLTALTGVSTATAAAPTSSGVDGQDLVDAARRYIGTPYVWGGESLSEGGLDCSGLVQRSFADLGVTDIPRVARDQGRIGTAVASMDDAKPGDLLIFNGGSHIGIYVGDGRMIDAPHRGAKVTERAVYETPTAIRRVLG
ncbi:C40 family peptidase [Demequina capsici]|uniref:C40 family peptidase n=1 Tax=Demequina capsici TaxID=3075620 RepID=A0AA96FDS0_9MICO|nr:C40 family peptidase [Demequina sp. PMTSA13]WNM26540.1 C40 family peptidase [Demequina sp. PMTSA13]